MLELRRAEGYQDALYRDALALFKDQLERQAQAYEIEKAKRDALRQLAANAFEQYRMKRIRATWLPLEREIGDLDDRLAALGVPNVPFLASELTATDS